MESGLYAMGVFEQQHCNYEHLFGQALCEAHVDGPPTERADGTRAPYLFGFSWLAGVEPALCFGKIIGSGLADRQIDSEPHGVRQGVTEHRYPHRDDTSNREKWDETDSEQHRDDHPHDDGSERQKHAHGGCTQFETFVIAFPRQAARLTTTSLFKP